MSRSVCVYCASSPGSEPAFGPLADEMGHALADAGHTLVYGGGSTGLMGRVARAVHGGGGRVVGVIPEAMKTVEVAYLDADELVVVETMRQRKQAMEDRADAFVVLPGGFGTLEELAEVITHRYLRFHTKPVVLLNAAGFYDPLLALFEHFIAAGMAKPAYHEHYRVAADVDGVMRQLEVPSVTA
ncbi:MAG: TIGR00730 family Rossman fold protein [Planctomycetota bacterium]